jgi:hypothetical protein
MITDYFYFRFYYPQGKPANEHFGDVVQQKILSVFQQFPNQQVPRDKFDTITKVCAVFLLICPILYYCYLNEVVYLSVSFPVGLSVSCLLEDPIIRCSWRREAWLYGSKYFH